MTRTGHDGWRRVAGEVPARRRFPISWLRAAVAGLALARAALPRQAHAQGRCGRSDLRPGTIAADLFADSAAVLAWMQREWPAGSGMALAHASFDSTGASGTLRVYASPELPIGRQAVQTQLNLLRRATGEPRRRTVLLLRNETGPEFRSVNVASSCAPTVSNLAYLTQRIEEKAADLRLFSSRTTVVWIFAREDGSAGEILVHRSSRNTAVDEAVVEIMRNARFRPAEIEGVPFPVWVQIPVGFQVQRRSGRQRPRHAGRQGKRPNVLATCLAFASRFRP
jgi:TonB family protein